MVASAILGVLVALALSAQAETPEDTAKTDTAPLIQATGAPELSLADRVWLDRFENELSALTPAALVVDAQLSEELLGRSEALETLYATDIGPAASAQLERIEGHLLRLGIWHAPVR
jgi:hypothetical protein